MTAEVAVMNRQGVALAADSAVTFREELGQKIFTSANKIYGLSKLQPVAIMIYGSADFMDIPWESIIKVYRKSLATKSFDRLHEYGDDFIGFLRNNDDLFSAESGKRFLLGNVYACYRGILDDIKQNVEAVISNEGEIQETEVKKIATEAITRHYKMWDEADSPLKATQKVAERLRKRFRSELSQIKKDVFQKLPFSKATSRKLTEIAVNLVFKFPDGLSHPGKSGIVIAGFGQRDIFPALKSFGVYGRVERFLKYQPEAEHMISFESDAAVVAFAQKEMVQVFMDGVEPTYQHLIEEFFQEVIRDYPGLILEQIDSISGPAKRRLLEKFRDLSGSQIKGIQKKLKIHRIETYQVPILRVVRGLPKDELAEMAEALVSLTSFKRKLSPEAETVGGPVDEAVISKGDGLVWIKRKHYFSRDLNPLFVPRYFNDIMKEEE